MIHLHTISLPEINPEDALSYPFSVPAVHALAGNAMQLRSAVTILVGENGSGKSTLLEGLACAAGWITVGSTNAEQDQTLIAVRRLARHLKLSWGKRTRSGFFMRSEDFFGFVKSNQSIRAGFERDLTEIDEEYKQRSELARNFARMPILRELEDMRQRYGADLDAASHGESYFTLFKSRFVPNGLYLLDEPEAPLSPMRQIGLLSMLKMMVEEQGAQFIIATHSPILMAYPDATIYGFGEDSIRTMRYNDIEHVTLMRDFLAHPQRYTRHL